MKIPLAKGILSRLLSRVVIIAYLAVTEDAYATNFAFRDYRNRTRWSAFVSAAFLIYVIIALFIDPNLVIKVINGLLAFLYLWFLNTEILALKYYKQIEDALKGDNRSALEDIKKIIDNIRGQVV